MKIAMYKGTGIGSELILYFSRGGYSHAAVILNDGSIIESKEFHGVRKRKNITDLLTKNYRIDIFDVSTTEEQDKTIEDFLVKQLGKGYDYWSVIGFVVYASKEGRRSYGRWFCSELVFAAFQKAGINLLDRVDAWKVSPTILSYNTKMNLSDSISFRYQQRK
jgi:uncharacterized protein YycO